MIWGEGMLSTCWRSWRRSIREEITELWTEYVDAGGEVLPLLKILIDESWDSLAGDDIAELQRFLSY